MQYKTWAPLSGLSTYMFIIQKMPYPKYVIQNMSIIQKMSLLYALYFH